MNLTGFRIVGKWAAIVGGMAAFGAAWAGNDLQVNVRPLLVGAQMDSPALPLVVSIDNPGEATHADVSLTYGIAPALRSIDLVGHGRTSFVAYVPTGYPFMQSSGTISVSTNRGNKVLQLGTVGMQSFAPLLDVTSDPKNVSAKFARVAHDFVRPADLPELSIGYRGFNAIILEAGAENMSAAAAAALKDFALKGGLVVLAGEDPSLLKDPNWKSFFFPARHCRLPDERSQSSPPKVPAWTKGPAVQSWSSLSSDELSAKAYGSGAAVYVRELTPVVTKYLSLGDLSASLAVRTTMSSYIEQRLEGAFSYATASSVANRRFGGSQEITAASFNSTQAANPFHVSLVSPGKIIGLLGLYFVLVIPFNLLLLRKLGRSELAWVVTPAVSLAFGVVFFRFASGFYHAQLAHQTVGLVLADQSSSDSYFIGESQFFFPKGGQYDLSFPGAQMVGPNDILPQIRSGNLELREDGGGVKPRLTVNNLTFAETRCDGRIANSRWISVKKLVLGPQEVTAVLKNDSPYSLYNCEMVTPTSRAVLEDFQPGEVKKIDASLSSGGFSSEAQELLGSLRQTDEYVYPTDSQVSLPADSVMFTAQISDEFHPGPKVGRVVAGTCILIENLGIGGDKR